MYAQFSPRRRPLKPSFLYVTPSPCRTPLYNRCASFFDCSSPWSCSRILMVSKLCVTVTAPQAATPPAMKELIKSRQPIERAVFGCTSLTPMSWTCCPDSTSTAPMSLRCSQASIEEWEMLCNLARTNGQRVAMANKGDKWDTFNECLIEFA